jgi:predicted membrane metal-binding protein
MSILSSRAATWIVPTWLIVIGLIGLLGAPLTSATSVFLIIAGLVAPAIALSLSQKPSARLADVPKERIP